MSASGKTEGSQARQSPYSVGIDWEGEATAVNMMVAAWMWGTFPTCPSGAQHKTDNLGITWVSLLALLDYPADYLKRWDELCLIAPHAGVSANDAHQNISLCIKLAEGNWARVEDALGEELIVLDAKIVQAIQPFPETTPVGDTLFRSGQLVHEADGVQLEYAVSEVGNYRVEV